MTKTSPYTILERDLVSLENFLAEIHRETGRSNFTDQRDWHGRSGRRLNEVREVLAQHDWKCKNYAKCRFSSRSAKACEDHEEACAVRIEASKAAEAFWEIERRNEQALADAVRKEAGVKP